MAPPPLLYHYTSASGLLGILSTGKLWATDIEFMNDAEELAYARRAVLGDLRARADEIAPPDEDSEDGMRAAVLRNVASELEQPPQQQASLTYHVYATCFCERGDLLSQWRAYGSGGGYAIGFRTARLHQMSTSLGQAHFRKVTYGVDAARRDLDAMLQAVAQNVAGFPGATGNIRLMEVVLPTVAAIKHPTFSEEQEWRLLLTGWGVPQALCFRPGSISLAPYLEISLPDNAVAQVVVSPGGYPAVRISGLRQLLERYGMGGVDIVGSASPLRV